eukprot:gnl/Trimastix_PCT/2242.p1 GENE.gnl/Trimastix_PCT/2242~~gnl/Trimastix_PCT/2242.p1  ORF type:complete len:175 (-),score=7.99 gnl/Trimastix_PCT/2242:118-642(-)
MSSFHGRQGNIFNKDRRPVTLVGNWVEERALYDEGNVNPVNKTLNSCANIAKADPDRSDFRTVYQEQFTGENTPSREVGVRQSVLERQRIELAKSMMPREVETPSSFEQTSRDYGTGFRPSPQPQPRALPDEPITIYTHGTMTATGRSFGAQFGRNADFSVPIAEYTKDTTKRC